MIVWSEGECLNIIDTEGRRPRIHALRRRRPPQGLGTAPTGARRTRLDASRPQDRARARHPHGRPPDRRTRAGDARPRHPTEIHDEIGSIDATGRLTGEENAAGFGVVDRYTGKCSGVRPARHAIRRDGMPS